MHRERPSRVRGAVVWTSTPTGPGSGLVLPDGCVDLLWRSDREEVLVAGPDTGAKAVEPVAGVTWTGLRFAPGHAPAVLGVPAAELRDARVALADLWGAAAARRVAEQVAAAPGAGLEALAAGIDPDPSLTRAARLLASGRAVADVADALGVGVRQLHRRSLDAFGYSPQLLGRVLRFRRAVAALRAGTPPAQVAAQAGFTDQAHLSREVRVFAGTTPGALRQASSANRSTDPPSGSSTVA
ncbi:helix-turn-helix domain-containing protein [Kineococcus sp. SYSU DK002]|uniref:helix-turn-helix domain-containing protein n=1 Tax=Kineococcus sp. SYSU DK002 TaxID=3383123 RepID=UPI003D7E678E